MKKYALIAALTSLVPTMAFGFSDHFGARDDGTDLTRAMIACVRRHRTTLPRDPVMKFDDARCEGIVKAWDDAQTKAEKDALAAQQQADKDLISRMSK